MIKGFLPYDDYLFINRELVQKIGLKEAIIFNEVLNMLKTPDIIQDNKEWVFVTIEDMQNKLPFMSVSTIQRMMDKMISEDILEVSFEWRRDAMDKRRWFTVGGLFR